MEVPKPKVLKDKQYKYWLVKEATPLSAVHAWFHTYYGIIWERVHLEELKKFAEGEHQKYLDRGKI